MFGLNNKLDTEWLGSVAFFEGFSSSELAKVAALGERIDVDAGTELIDQGRVGDECYVIVEGSAAIHMQNEYITSVSPGSMVGEMALVEFRPRNATVTAETDMVLVRFGITDFRKLLSASATTHDRVMALLRERLAANEQRSR
ncbi:MAG: cyclic nucleotide-binding domain-containing protein [Actinomycetota bacterium]